MSTPKKCYLCGYSVERHLLYCDSFRIWVCNGQSDPSSPSHAGLIIDHDSSSTFEGIQCQKCHCRSPYVLGIVDRIRVCSTCLLNPSVIPIDSRKSFKPIFQNNHLISEVCLSPSTRVPKIPDLSQKLISLRNHGVRERFILSEQPLPRLPLIYKHIDEFRYSLTQFVRVEQEAEHSRHIDQWRHPIDVRWVSARKLEFRLTKRQSEGLAKGNPLHLLANGQVAVTGALECDGPKPIAGIAWAVLATSCSLFGTSPVYLGFDIHNVGFRRQHSALTAFPSADEWWKRLFLGHLAKIRNSFEEADKRSGFMGGVLPTLHKSQLGAIDFALSHPFALIQGPPGTGKSTCIVEQALALVESEWRVLIASRTNVSCDHILRMLTRRLGVGKDVNVVRVIGQSYRELVPKDVRRQCSHAIAERRRMLEGDVIRAAHVVIATTCTVGGSRFCDYEPDALIVDEANQLVDPELLIPLRHNPETVTIYGDFKQIGPYCHSLKTRQNGYGISLMERIQMIYEKNRSVEFSPIMLTGQYRMHPELAVFPSLEFYDGRLSSGCSVAERTRKLSALRYPNPNVPLIFWDMKSCAEQHSTDGQSFFNPIETLALVDVLMRLHQSGVGAHSIGVITFYAAQVDYAVEAIPKIAKLPTAYAKEIEINTVDAYEGRDIDFVILVCVRSNAQHRIGFLDDPGRMNVALTRSKFGLFVIGDAETLQNDTHWGHFVNYCREKKVMVSNLQSLGH